ncbi:MAG: hypothetical protein ACTTK4_06445, partial [Porphyromonas gingivalis]
ADKRLPDDAPKRDMSGQNRYAARLPDGGLAKVVTGCLSAVYKYKMGGGGVKCLYSAFRRPLRGYRRQ